MLYAVSYFSLVRDDNVSKFCDIGGPEILEFYHLSTSYRGIPIQFHGIFEPAHSIDRAYIRPQRWDWTKSKPNPLWMNYRRTNRLHRMPR